MSTAAFIFPHQLFADHPAISKDVTHIFLIEDSLFFGDPHHPVKMHQQKLWLHRTSMTRYAERLKSDGHEVEHLRFDPDQSPLRKAMDKVVESKIKTLRIADVHDNLLGRRIRRYATAEGVTVQWERTPAFLNSSDENRAYREGKKRWYMADFYQHQRRRLDILLNGDEPVGGQWSFDEDNRKKLPKRMVSAIPELPSITLDEVDQNSKHEIESEFGDHPGSLENLFYPTSHQRSAQWLDEFLEQRFHLFGDYEDAIVPHESWLYHSVLTPMLNIGLLTPQQIIDAAIEYSITKDVPINSTEGFVRQIIGWREFMRATYEDLHVKMRRTNHWQHHRKIPKSFWDATTGIDPVDDCITRANRTGYLHHIERLMVIGGFMFLCEFDPDEIYKWFMEMFVDSYDWVMVPNAYAMSQNADGGLITTKPYFSGSNYVKKMSHWRQGPWAETWDGLYWRWIWNHRESLASNPRWAMMCKMVERMDESKRDQHLKNASDFLSQLDQSPKYFS